MSGVSMPVALSFLARHDLTDLHRSLEEPSGLALDRDGQHLWTFSDDAATLFRLTLDPIALAERVRVGHKGLEGIAAAPDGETLLGAVEEGRLLLRVRGGDVEVFPLSELQGSAAISSLFEEANKGIEGITWDPTRGRWLLLKEGRPGLLLAVDAALSRIEVVARLTEAMGFVSDDPRVKVDFSGMDYDAGRGLLWIVSDQARTVYLFDPQTLRVRQRLPLRSRRKRKKRAVKKPEGIALDAARSRLYIVSDEDAELYIYAITGELFLGGGRSTSRD